MDGNIDPTTAEGLMIDWNPASSSKERGVSDYDNEIEPITWEKVGLLNTTMARVGAPTTVLREMDR